MLKKNFGTVFFVFHVAWVLLLVIYCGTKFVWLYDWSPMQDYLYALFTMVCILLELFQFGKPKQHKEQRIISNRTVLFFDGFTCFVLSVLPWFAGKPTFSYIGWNMFFPVSVIGISIITRHRHIKKDNDEKAN